MNFNPTLGLWGRRKIGPESVVVGLIPKRGIDKHCTDTIISAQHLGLCCAPLGSSFVLRNAFHWTSKIVINWRKKKLAGFWRLELPHGVVDRDLPLTCAKLITGRSAGLTSWLGLGQKCQFSP